MPIKLKNENADVIIGFNNSSKPLGQRKDLHLLLEGAVAHNNRNILDLFEEVPTLEEIKNIKGQKFEKEKTAK